LLGSHAGGIDIARQRIYVLPMGYACLRRLVVAVSLLAFAGAGFVSPMAAAQPHMRMSMQNMSDGSMPCCPEKAPSCVTDVGCAFLIGLPLAPSLTSTTLSWSALTYTVTQDGGEGISLQPALGPPILLA
jgi:hypothetical protein